MICENYLIFINYIKIACLASLWVRKCAYMCTAHWLFVCLLIKFVRVELVKERFTCGGARCTFSSAYSIEKACTCSSQPVASCVNIDSAIINIVSYFYNLSANRYWTFSCVILLFLIPWGSLGCWRGDCEDTMCSCPRVRGCWGRTWSECWCVSVSWVQSWE